MSKKTKIVLKKRNCKRCNDGYYVALYHEKHTNNFIRVGSNCACARTEISEEHVMDLKDEMLHPEKYQMSLL